MKAVEVRRSRPRAPTLDELDGLTVQLADGGWFNLRASNTEPLLRLNVEAPDSRTGWRRCATSARVPETWSAPRTCKEPSVALDPQLLEILACPATHHAPLDYDAGGRQLTCTGATGSSRSATTSRCCCWTRRAAAEPAS